MHDRREARRPDRVEAAQQAQLDDPRHNLRRPDEHTGGDRRPLAGTGRFEQARQLRRHRAGDEGGRGEIEGEDRHRAARRFAPGGVAHLMPGGRQRRRRRNDQPVQRHRHEKVEGSPDQAGLAPAERMFEPRRERPADRAGKAGDQGDAGDRGARLTAIEPRQRGKGRVVETDRHADPEHQPGEGEAPHPLRETEKREPRGNRRTGKREHGAPAMSSISRPTHGPTARATAAARPRKCRKTRLTDRPRAAAIGAPRIAGR